jgi:hypothetical protein
MVLEIIKFIEFIGCCVLIGVCIYAVGSVIYHHYKYGW